VSARARRDKDRRREQRDRARPPKEYVPKPGDPETDYLGVDVDDMGQMHPRDGKIIR